MGDQSVFSDNNEQQEQQSQTTDNNNSQSGDIYADQLKTIVNEDGQQKYGTVDKALEALKHSQSFIPTLQSEKTALEAEVVKLREQVAQNKGVQDVVDELSNRQQSNQSDHSETPLGEERIAEIVANALKQRDTVNVQSGNAQKVEEALKGKFGDKTKEVIVAKAKELGTTPAKLGELAKDSPEMVLALFSAKPTQSSATTTSYNFNSDPQKETLQRPEKSLLSGATNKEQLEFMQKVRAEVYAKYDIKE